MARSRGKLKVFCRFFEVDIPLIEKSERDELKCTKIARTNTE